MDLRYNNLLCVCFRHFLRDVRAIVGREQYLDVMRRVDDFKKSGENTEKKDELFALLAGLISQLHHDTPTTVVYHALFGSSQIATELFMEHLVGMSGDIGVCRALVKCFKNSVADVDAFLKEALVLLRPFPPAAMDLCNLVVRDRHVRGVHPMYRMDPEKLFKGDDAFYRAVTAGGNADADLAPLMASYVLTGDAFACCRLARGFDARSAHAHARTRTRAHALFTSCIPLLVEDAGRWFDLLREGDADSWPYDRTWNALKELRPTLVLEGERLPEPADGIICVAIPVDGGRLVLHCRAETDCMFPKLDWFTHRFLSRYLEQQQQQQQRMVTVDLLERQPAESLPVAAALQALLIAMHPTMRLGPRACPRARAHTRAHTHIDGSILAAVLGPRLHTALEGPRITELAASAVNGCSVDADGRSPSTASTMAALRERLGTIPAQFFAMHFGKDDCAASYALHLGRPMTPTETLLIRTISPAVLRWSRITASDYAAAAEEFGRPASSQIVADIRKVLSDTAVAEKQLTSPSQRAAAVSNKNKRRKMVSGDVRTAASGRDGCLSVMARTLEVAGELREAELATGQLSKACHRLLLIAAWQDAVNSHASHASPVHIDGVHDD